MRIEKKTFKTALKQASGIVKEKGIAQNLSVFYFKPTVEEDTGDEVVFIAGSDGQITFLQKVHCAGIDAKLLNKPFRIPAQRLLEIVNFADGDFNFILDDSDDAVMHIESATSSWSLRLSDADYIDIPFELFDETEFTDILSAPYLYSVLKRVMPAMADSSSLDLNAKNVYFTGDVTYASDSSVATMIKCNTINQYFVSDKIAKCVIDILDQYKRSQNETGSLDFIMTKADEELDGDAAEFDAGANVKIKLVDGDTSILVRIGDEVFHAVLSTFDEPVGFKENLLASVDSVDIMVLMDKTNFYRSIRRAMVCSRDNTIIFKAMFTDKVAPADEADIDPDENIYGYVHLEADSDDAGARDSVEILGAYVKTSEGVEKANQSKNHVIKLSCVQLYKALLSVHGPTVAFKYSKNAGVNNIIISDPQSVCQTLMRAAI